MHEPVLVTEVIQGLALRPGQIVVDLTAGSGGHAEKLLEIVGSLGQLILVDRDPDAIERCRERLRDKRDRVKICRAAFSECGRVLSQLHVEKVHGILIDLGVSREQLEGPSRGFSFMREGPLDMRMDPNLPVSAADLVRTLPEGDLADAIWRYGEERFSRRIARAICKEREKASIDSTKTLADIVSKAVGRRGKIHPATRVFQALRILVNQELTELETVLPVAVERLVTGGRLAVIAYHSLEDRIVKKFFRKEKETGQIFLVNKKPVTASRTEIEQNPSARSAKLRIVARS